ncbi:MAG: efflux transporter outer membrane subunit, partial [Gammaproteobacteria bacterium]|nr:efflux transporter outer membrane subunit [Gammaproteobacteria bacterium]
MTEGKFCSVFATRKIRFTLGAVAVAWLAGCSMIPAYERPAAPVPESFPGVGEATASPLVSWREYFPDPSLHDLIEAALNHNRDLRIALARVDEARALAGIARADRLPTVEAQASANRSRTPGDLTGTGQPLVASRYDAGLGVTAFELDFWGRVAALNEAARAQYLATDEAAKSFRIGLVSDVANTWFLLTELAERERLAAETLQTREESLALIRRRREVGLATELDVLAAESLVESVRIQWTELKRQRDETQNALSLLTGMGAGIPVPTNVAGQPSMAELAPGLPSEVLLRRPDVRAAEQRLIAANASVGAAR